MDIPNNRDKENNELKPASPNNFDASIDLFESGASATPVADVSYSESTLGAQAISAHYAYNIKIPNSDIEDFVIQTRASVLSKARQKLKDLTTKKFPWAELLLAMASGTLGSAISLFVTNGKTIPTTAWILSIITTGLGVTYYSGPQKQDY